MGTERERERREREEREKERERERKEREERERKEREKRERREERKEREERNRQTERREREREKRERDRQTDRQTERQSRQWDPLGPEDLPLDPDLLGERKARRTQEEDFNLGYLSRGSKHFKIVSLLSEERAPSEPQLLLGRQINVLVAASNPSFVLFHINFLLYNLSTT